MDWNEEGAPPPDPTAPAATSDSLPLHGVDAAAAAAAAAAAPATVLPLSSPLTTATQPQHNRWPHGVTSGKNASEWHRWHSPRAKAQ